MRKNVNQQRYNKKVGAPPPFRILKLSFCIFIINNNFEVEQAASIYNLGLKTDITTALALYGIIIRHKADLQHVTLFIFIS